MSAITIAGDTSGSITLDAPAVAGSNTLTLPAATGTLALTSNVIGVNQTWQVLTGSRSASTTYTNSTGKPIAVSILLASSLSISDNILTVGGVIAWKIYNNNVRDQTAFTIVPNGSTYVLTLGSGASIAAWYELR
jgi:hypothetical protein